MNIKNIKDFRPKFRILSPDGFDIYPGKVYKDEAEGEKAFKKWAKNYEGQGYYSTIRDGERLRIPVAELSDYCMIRTVWEK